MHFMAHSAFTYRKMVLANAYKLINSHRISINSDRPRSGSNTTYCLRPTCFISTDLSEGKHRRHDNHREAGGQGHRGAGGQEHREAGDRGS